MRLRLFLVIQTKHLEEGVIHLGETTLGITRKERRLRNLERILFRTEHLTHTTTTLDIADRKDEIARIHQVNDRNRHLTRELRAILVQAVRIDHHVTIIFQALADTLHDFRRKTRNIERYRLVEDLFLRVAKMLFRTRIHLEDVPVRIRNHHGIVHSRQKLAEQRFAIFRNEQCGHSPSIIPQYTSVSQSPVWGKSRKIRR